MAVFVLARLDNEVLRGLTECIVAASTRIGANPFYGETFNLAVSRHGLFNKFGLYLPTLTIKRGSRGAARRHWRDTTK
jgi:hypothetical protein